MPQDQLLQVLAGELADLREKGTAKGEESVVTRVIPAREGRGPRFLLAGHGEREFLRMNSNSYLGMSFQPEVIAAEEEAARAYGTGPGAVRFISGTYDLHVALERRLADFHRREAAMIFSSAYATVLSTIVPLVTDQTALISDALNHNCIINAMRLARPARKEVYRHNDVARPRAPARPSAPAAAAAPSSSPTASSRCAATTRRCPRSSRWRRSTTVSTPRT